MRQGRNADTRVGVPLKSPTERGVSSQLENCTSLNGVEDVPVSLSAPPIVDSNIFPTVPDGSGPRAKSLNTVLDYNQDVGDKEMKSPSMHQCEEPPVPRIPNYTSPERPKPPIQQLLNHLRVLEVSLEAGDNRKVTKQTSGFSRDGGISRLFADSTEVQAGASTLLGG